MTINIQGTVEVKPNIGKNHTFTKSDFNEDKHIDGSGSTFSAGDPSDFAIEIFVENKSGVLATGDWDTEKCEIVNDNLNFSLEV